MCCKNPCKTQKLDKNNYASMESTYNIPQLQAYFQAHDKFQISKCDFRAKD